MWSFRLCVWMWMWACACAVKLHEGDDEVELRCHSIDCRDAGKARYQARSFIVERNKIRIRIESSDYFELECFGWRALKSLSLPQFVRAVRVRRVTLRSCGPDERGAVARALAALGVRLQPGGELHLPMLAPPHAPLLAAAHLAGLEDLHALTIGSIYGYSSVKTDPVLAAGFLDELRDLRNLTVGNVKLPAGEFDRPHATLRRLELVRTDVDRLPDAALLLPNLTTLIVDERRFEINGIPKTLRQLDLKSQNTTLRLNDIPELETMRVEKWSERRPEALTRCDVLQRIQLSWPAMEALPNFWLASCRLLKEIYVSVANRLKTLPPKLFEGARQLEDISFTLGVLETLPEGLFNDLPNLRRLSLDSNRIRMLPSGLFAGAPGIEELYLQSNQLQQEAPAALAPLHNLTDLDLSRNPNLGDFCNSSDDNSFLHKANKLSRLRLEKTGITRICRDWRLNLTNLWILNLNNAEISDLRYADITEYIRNKSRQCEVWLLNYESSYRTYAVRFTKDDYQKALTASEDQSVRLSMYLRLECDCRMYWTRLALENAPGAKHYLRDLKCKDGRNLKEWSIQELCPNGTSPKSEHQLQKSTSTTTIASTIP